MSNIIIRVSPYAIPGLEYRPFAKHAPTAVSIFNIVCNYFNVDADLISAETRIREVVKVRQIAHFFAKNTSKQSLAEIGRAIGNKDHATVLHSVKSVKDLYATDKRFATEMKTIYNKLCMDFQKKLTLTEMLA
jgi:chromosomal replication initiation ATPase DnaA